MTVTEIGNADIAVMCDIARASGFDLDADKQALIDRLIAQHLVRATGQAKPRPAFELTDEGQRLLDERGVGVNEA